MLSNAILTLQMVGNACLRVSDSDMRTKLVSIRNPLSIYPFINIKHYTIIILS